MASPLAGLPVIVTTGGKQPDDIVSLSVYLMNTFLLNNVTTVSSTALISGLFCVYVRTTKTNTNKKLQITTTNFFMYSFPPYFFANRILFNFFHSKSVRGKNNLIYFLSFQPRCIELQYLEHLPV
jgi:hypothetical protein